MKAPEFKARCLGLIDEIAESGGAIVIRDDFAEPVGVAWKAEKGLPDGG